MITKALEKWAVRFLQRRGCMVLPRGWRGLAVGGPMTIAICDKYDNTDWSRFTVDLGPYSQLVAVNYSYIGCTKAKVDRSVDMEGASA